MFISQGLRILARSSFSSTHISPASTLIAFFPGQINAATYSNVAYFSTNLNEKRKVSESSSIDYEESPQIVLTKENIPQSPWKMRFLVTLVSYPCFLLLNVFILFIFRELWKFKRSVLVQLVYLASNTLSEYCGLSFLCPRLNLFQYHVDS